MLSEQEHKKKGEKTMNKILSVHWWIDILVSTFFTILVMYLIKVATNAVKIPVVTDVVNEVV